MSDDDQPRKVIAHVTAGTPPATVRTIAEWLAWRTLEDVRMEAELAAQREAYFEREAGVTEH